MALTAAHFVLAAGLFLAPWRFLRPLDLNFSASDGLFLLAWLLLLRHGVLKVYRGLKPLVLGAVLLVSGFALSSIGHLAVDDLIQVSGQYLFVCLIVFPAVASLERPRGLKMALIALSGLLLPAAVAVAGNYLGWDSFGSAYLTGTTAGRSNSVLGNPNAFGKHVALYIPVIAYLWHAKVLPMVWALVAATISLASLFAAASFGGLVCACFAVVLVVLLLLPVARGLGSILVLCVLVVWGASWDALPAVTESRLLPAIENRDPAEAGSFDFKLDLASEAWDRIAASPMLGAGAGRYPRVSRSGLNVHNSYLLTWAEGGILAILGLCTILTWLLLLGLSRSRLPHQASSRRLLAVVVMVFMLASMTNTHAYARSDWIPIALALSLARSAGGLAPRTPRMRVLVSESPS